MFISQKQLKLVVPVTMCYERVCSTTAGRLLDLQPN